MTATLTPAPASAAIGRDDQLRVTQSRVVLSEWTKFRSLRSTVYTLLVAVVLMIGLGALLSAVAASQPNGLDAGATAISTSLTGTFFAQLAIGVMGVLLITGEYSTGMIRASLAVVPARLPMLWAKLAVCAGAVFLTMLVSSLTAFTLGQAVLSRKYLNASLSDPAALRDRRRRVVPDRGRDHGSRAGCTAAQHRRRNLHLRRGLLRDSAAGPPPARIMVGPFRAVPAIQRWRDDAAGQPRPRPPAVTMDRIRGDVRLRIGPYRVRRMATAARRRLTLLRAPGRTRPGSAARREGFRARPARR